MPRSSAHSHSVPCSWFLFANFRAISAKRPPPPPGAGGLAGQHRLGASTGWSMVALGLFKISLSLLAARGSLLPMLDAIPTSILGVLLVLAGHELALTGVLTVVAKKPKPGGTPFYPPPPPCDLASADSSGVTAAAGSITSNSTSNSDPLVVCLITALVIVATGHAHIGALCGCIACAIYGGGGGGCGGGEHPPPPWDGYYCNGRNRFCSWIGSTRSSRGGRRGGDEGRRAIMIGNNNSAGQIQGHQYTPLGQGIGSHYGL